MITFDTQLKTATQITRGILLVGKAFYFSYADIDIAMVTDMVKWLLRIRLIFFRSDGTSHKLSAANKRDTASAVM